MCIHAINKPNAREITFVRLCKVRTTKLMDVFMVRNKLVIIAIIGHGHDSCIRRLGVSNRKNVSGYSCSANVFRMIAIDLRKCGSVGTDDCRCHLRLLLQQVEVCHHSYFGCLFYYQFFHMPIITVLNDYANLFLLIFLFFWDNNRRRHY